MDVRTHLAISTSLVGQAIAVAPERATCQLKTTPAMAADDRGLVHGGFVFGLADYAAMLAVGDPNVVLGAADVRFLAPVTVGQMVVAHASSSGAGKKRVVDVLATVESSGSVLDVFRGQFTCFVLPSHILDKETT